MRALVLGLVAAGTLLAGCDDAYGPRGYGPPPPGYAAYDYDRPDPAYNGYYADRYYRQDRRARERRQHPGAGGVEAVAQRARR